MDSCWAAWSQAKDASRPRGGCRPLPMGIRGCVTSSPLRWPRATGSCSSDSATSSGVAPSMTPPPAGRAGGPRAPFSSPHRSVTTRRPSLSPRHISWTPASGGSSRNGRRLSEDTRTRTSGVRGEVALRAQWSGVTSQCAVKASAASTTIVRPATERVADFVSGFVVAEGCFTRTGSPPKFTFSLALGAADATTCTLLKSLFGVGFVLRSPRRKPHYDDEVVFQVRRMKDLLTVIVPFMDEHLPPSYKRVQYKIWRAELVDYWDHRAKRVRPCQVPGCAEPRRAHGLCRRHLYLEERDRRVRRDGP